MALSYCFIVDSGLLKVTFLHIRKYTVLIYPVQLFLTNVYTCVTAVQNKTQHLFISPQRFSDSLSRVNLLILHEETRSDFYN